MLSAIAPLYRTALLTSPKIEDTIILVRVLQPLLTTLLHSCTKYLLPLQLPDGLSCTPAVASREQLYPSFSRLSGNCHLDPSPPPPLLQQASFAQCSLFNLFLTPELEQLWPGWKLPPGVFICRFVFTEVNIKYISILEFGLKLHQAPA